MSRHLTEAVLRFPGSRPASGVLGAEVRGHLAALAGAECDTARAPAGDRDGVLGCEVA